MTIAVCNTVKINRLDSSQSEEASQSPEEQQIEYLADSPDEKALVEACRKYGVVLSESDDKGCLVKIGPKVIKFKKLDIFEFDSTRKRMSVITETEDGKYLITWDKIHKANLTSL